MPPSPDSPVPAPVGAAVGALAPAPSLSRAASVAVPTLTDFLDLATLEEIQEGFSAITSVRATIRDAAGQPLLTPDDTLQRRRSDSVLSQLLLTDGPNAQGPFEVPIIVDGHTLGSIAIDFPDDPNNQQPAAQQGVPEPNPLLASAKRALRLLESNGAGAWAAAVELRKGIESAEASLLPEPVTAASSKRPRVR